MKVAVFGHSKDKILPLLSASGFSITSENPEFVVSYGGDGTLMRAEAAFPGIPKIILKDSFICKKCSYFSNEIVLEKIQKGDYEIEEMFKLSAAAKGTELIGFNDIVVHNKDPRHAIRYRVKVDGKEIPREIIGDGIVVATPFGSTGYYRSITDSFFEIGIGLAFNNSTEQSDHMILGEGSVIELAVSRGPAIVYADNHEKTIDLGTDGSVRIKRAEEKAKVVRAR